MFYFVFYELFFPANLLFFVRILFNMFCLLIMLLLVMRSDYKDRILESKAGQHTLLARYWHVFHPYQQQFKCLTNIFL